MLPLSDESGRLSRFPIVTVALILLNVVVFLYQITLPARAEQQFILAYGAVPQEITSGRDLPPLIDLPIEATLITSMFLHGGWLHIIGNMLYLWVFGDNVEDALSPIPYLAYYLACGVVAGLAQVMFDPYSRVPSIGASGAVAGVLGGYFVLHPTNRVNTLVILGIFIRVVALPAWVLLGFWFILQFFSGVTTTDAAAGGVAYWAHVGGFVIGMVLMIPVALVNRLRGGTPRRRDWDYPGW